MDLGTDAILLGAETLRGLYPVETISIVGKICAEVSYSTEPFILTILSQVMYISSILLVFVDNHFFRL